MELSVSVIIPVYNAASFVTKAVASCASLKEVSEVILIEDGSRDNSYDACLALSSEYAKVKLLTHASGQNKGAGASRNLGIKVSTTDFIAFLDADDIYLANRFIACSEIFTSHPEIHATYEACGFTFESEEIRHNYIANNQGNKQLITTLRPCKNYKTFYEAAPIGNKGHCHLNSLTLKRSAIDKAGYFNEHLPLHQDTEFLLRLSAACNMMHGDAINPVAMRRVHAGNRITKKRSRREMRYHRIRMWYFAWIWLKRKSYKKEASTVFSNLIYCAYSSAPTPIKGNVIEKIKKVCLRTKFMISACTPPKLTARKFALEYLSFQARKYFPTR